MRPGEVIVVRLKGGVRVVRVLEATASEARLALGRNREARVSRDRVILATGLVAAGEEAVAQLRDRSEQLASSIDLSEVWDLAREEDTSLSLDDLAELVWGPSPELAYKVALLLHLERVPLYFVQRADGYAPQSRRTVSEALARCTREAERAEQSASLVERLSRGALPAEITPFQAGLLEDLRGYVIYGEDYPRYRGAKGLVEGLAAGNRDRQRVSFDLLVAAGVLCPDEPLELHRAGLSDEFSEEVLAEAASLDPAAALDSPGRRDLTEVRTVTIDDAGTEDRDDAVSLEAGWAEGDVRQGSCLVGIHVADAGAIVPAGGAIDREADRRMATLYLPELKIGMLPPRLSNELGSLVPGERRAAVSLMVQIDGSGDVVGWELFPSIIRSRAALTYEEVDLALDNASDPSRQWLSSLDLITQSLRRKREAAGAIILERPEMHVTVGPSGEPYVRVIARSSPSRRLVAELMILCNAILAEFCRRQDVPASYRSQRAPDLGGLPEGAANLAEYAKSPLGRHLVLGRLPPAEIDILPAPHRGLGVSAYTQATSPLRRYPDLVMQRQISHFLSSGKPLYPRDAVESVAQRAEEQLREMTRLEESRKRYWFLKYLQRTRLQSADCVGGAATFDATVLENKPGRPGLLELSEYPFRVRALLSPRCSPGDTATLRLHDVDLWRRSARFVHVEARR